jgi:hypothetical protein
MSAAVFWGRRKSPCNWHKNQSIEEAFHEIAINGRLKGQSTRFFHPNSLPDQHTEFTSFSSDDRPAMIEIELVNRPNSSVHWKLVSSLICLLQKISLQKIDWQLSSPKKLDYHSLAGSFFYRNARVGRAVISPCAFGECKISSFSAKGKIK